MLAALALDPFRALIAIGCIVYLLPSLVAFSRRPPNAGSIYVVNVLLGWSLVGWVVALSMAVRSRPAVVVVAPALLRDEARARSVPPEVSSGPALDSSGSDVSTLERWLRDRA